MDKAQQMISEYRAAAAGSGLPEPTLQRLIDVAGYIERHASATLPLKDLATIADLSPSYLQRQFKAAFGLSPKAFQDALRLRQLREGLKAGERVTDAIYDAGFGSVSRVYGEAGRQLGMSPSRYRQGGKGETLVYACRDTSLGLMMMAASATGVCFVQFGDSPSQLLAQLKGEFPKANLEPSTAQHAQALDDWMSALDLHLEGKVPRPEIPLDMRGTAFQMTVWQFLLSVKEGEVVSYTELANRLGRPKAVRAAASACARNKIAVLIPCHRVLRSDGGLGGYRWGLERKTALLEREQR